MLPFGVIIPAAVPQRSEIPEGLTNYPVYNLTGVHHYCVFNYRLKKGCGLQFALVCL
jgi:hypothetical protein